MHTAILMIQFWGLYLVITAAIFILRPAAKLQVLKMAKDPMFSVLAGFMALIIGLASLVIHHEWQYDIHIIPTIFGIIALLKGIILIAFPDMLSRKIDKLSSPVFAFLMIAVLFAGIALLWYGSGLPY